MIENAKRRTRLKVHRGSAGETPRFQNYDIEFEPGESVLDGLRWLRAQEDPSLAVRYACINANACKQCVMRIDGRTAYACTTRLTEGEMTIEPLPNKPLIRDLVTDTRPPDEKL
jgi:succinate dehydrogenase/fumarate reductase-like Fe-S protein